MWIHINYRYPTLEEVSDDNGHELELELSSWGTSATSAPVSISWQARAEASIVAARSALKALGVGILIIGVY